MINEGRLNAQNQKTFSKVQLRPVVVLFAKNSGTPQSRYQLPVANASHPRLPAADVAAGASFAWMRKAQNFVQQVKDTQISSAEGTQSSACWRRLRWNHISAASCTSPFTRNVLQIPAEVILAGSQKPSQAHIVRKVQYRSPCARRSCPLLRV